MAEVELTKEELDAKIDEAKKEALSSLVEGTSWNDANALKESAVNADKKISELGGTKKTLEEQLADSEKKNEELLSKIKTVEPKPEEKKPSDDEVIKSLNEEEAKVLDQAMQQNPELKKKIADGGEKAQAEAIVALRETMPKTIPDDLFSGMLKKNASKSVPMDESSIAGLLSKEFEKNRKKGLTPAMSGTGIASGGASHVEDEAPVRGGGGLGELAQEKS